MSKYEASPGFAGSMRSVNYAAFIVVIVILITATCFICPSCFYAKSRARKRAAVAPGADGQPQYYDQNGPPPPGWGPPPTYNPNAPPYYSNVPPYNPNVPPYYPNEPPYNTNAPPPPPNENAPPPQRKPSKAQKN